MCFPRSYSATCALAIFAALGLAASSNAQDMSVCLITKTDTNPFFIKMKEGALAKANERGVALSSYAGRIDGDNESQVAAIESCIANGAKGIAITPSDAQGIVPTVQRARDAGLLVIALDTPLNPIDAADDTFGTNNFEAGRLLGAWAAATLGGNAGDARIAFLDLAPSQPTVDVQRDQGFMAGFGIDTKDPNVIGDEDDARIVGHDVTHGNEEGGRTAMESLLQQDPTINVVYTINEPAAAGAYEALRALGRESDVLVVSIDGGCPGIANVANGVIGATSQQYPSRMAAAAIDTIVDYALSGTKPECPPETGFNPAGTEVAPCCKDPTSCMPSLVTDKPVEGVSSISTAEGLDMCWG